MKRKIAVLLVVVLCNLLFIGCSNKVDKYDKLIDYLNENGVQTYKGVRGSKNHTVSMKNKDNIILVDYVENINDSKSVFNLEIEKGASIIDLEAMYMFDIKESGLYGTWKEEGNAKLDISLYKLNDHIKWDDYDTDIIVNGSKVSPELMYADGKGNLPKLDSLYMDDIINGIKNILNDTNIDDITIKDLGFLNIE
ncbi:MAG: hypothetical protein HFE90_05990 [Firmicutes bacterium]|nr:hypothetical protein [Bacillota bacterium]